VHVFEHEQARLLELAQENSSNVPWFSLGRDPDVEERPERRRCREVLAGAAQDRSGHAGDELAHERGLAHTGLAADEDEVAALVQKRAELREQILTLEQLGHLPLASLGEAEIDLARRRIRPA